MSRNKKIARVFPTKTNMSPTDQDVFFNVPPYMVERGYYDEVHVSVTFTWDIEYGKFLKYQWETVCDNVKIGGPAFDDPGGQFIPGRYLKKGVTITSRGCPNNCSYCFVPKREGKLRELKIYPGHIIQDNNLLACSKKHIRQVFEMLKGQKRIEFVGGFESRRVTDDVVDELRSLNIYHIWLAYDKKSDLKPLKKAVNKLKKHFNRWKLRCYVLIGGKNDNVYEAEQRLLEVWRIGCMPFAMLYQNENGILNNDKEWIKLQREFVRPTITIAKCKKETGILK